MTRANCQQPDACVAGKRARAASARTSLPCRAWHLRAHASAAPLPGVRRVPRRAHASAEPGPGVYRDERMRRLNQDPEFAAVPMPSVALRAHVGCTRTRSSLRTATSACVGCTRTGVRQYRAERMGSAYASAEPGWSSPVPRRAHASAEPGPGVRCGQCRAWCERMRRLHQDLEFAAVPRRACHASACVG